ncbi:PREDICTED: 39S ribosomal protein L44, mitochondrial [Nicrophorus vespilloides]|uniref:Large ribosomal subunit protein mL44 n=1 Tax=Nicrophorus vespilloides TaxID=110193 RepID=A0ABM1NJE1_NICVS|nr:PREDICTED: 39S ribosomal protein L44, mitochondrial [Nicrophorus vespilloides]
MALQRQGLNLLRRISIHGTTFTNRTDVRSYKRWVAPTLKELNIRTKKIGDTGEVKPTPRSSFLEWNYDAEVFAFGKRLGEEFNQDLLRKALMHKSYVNLQELQGNAVQSDGNTDLIKKGEDIISKYIQLELSKKYPDVIVQAIHNYLTDDNMLSHVGVHIGLKDIILTPEYPPETATIANTFKAVVAALEESSSLENCEKFVKDFVLAQLNGKEVFDIWEPEQPYKYLKGIKSDIEPRLCNQSAAKTILANYQVGIYSNKQLLGLGWGESVDVAKDMAALNVIQKIYNIK